jgi:hypothetical protein
VVTPRIWQPFGIPAEEYERASAGDGAHVLNLSLRRARDEQDRAGKWLRNAMLALAVLAAAAAAVSYQAQYVLIQAVKHTAAIAYLQAGIPDIGAAVFACLGIALALQGRRALRARALNVVCVGISIAMNALASRDGWRPLAVWVMAPVLYALASDTLIGVIRAWNVARQRALSEALAEEEITPLAMLGGVLLWLLRLCLDPRGTLSGFRRWVIEECPVAPGRRLETDTSQLPATAYATRAAARRARLVSAPRGETKTARFLALVTKQHGPLAALPLDRVSRIASELAPEVELNTGAARTALRARVLAEQDGAQR